MMQAQRTMKPILGISLFAIFSTVVLLLATFANTGERINLSATATSLAPGETTTVTVTLETGDDPLLGVNGSIEYDATKLAFVSFTPGTSAIQVAPPATPNDGSVELVGFLSLSATEGVVGEAIALATMEFRALSEVGVSSISVSDTSKVSIYEDGSTVDANAGSVSITVEDDTATADTGDSTDAAAATTGAATGEATGEAATGEAATGEATTGEATTGTTTGSTGTTGTDTGSDSTTGTPTGSAVYITSSSNAAGVGDTVDLDILINTGSEGLIGMSSVLNYDTSKLKFSSFTIGTAFDTPDPTATAADGTIEIIGFVPLTATTGVTGNGLSIGTATFEVLATGATVSVDGSTQFSLFSDGSVFTPATLATYTVSSVGATTGAATTGATSGTTGTTTGATTGATSGTTGATGAAATGATTGATSGTTGTTTGAATGAATSGATTGATSGTTGTTGTTTGASTGNAVKPLVSITPSDAQTVVGKAQTFSLYIDTKGEALIGTNLVVNYDSSIASFNSFTEGTSGFQIAAPASPGDGSIELVGFTSLANANGANGGRLLLGRFTLTPNKTGSANISIASSSVVSTIDGDVVSVIGTSAKLRVSQGGGDTVKPTAPIELRADAPNSSTVRLSWSPSQDASGIDTYVISRKRTTSANFDDSLTKRTVDGTRTQYDSRDVFAGVSYQFRVRAVDNSGNVSAFSNVVTINVPARQTTPTNPSPSTPTQPIVSNPGTGGSPVITDDPITEDDIQAVEDPAEVFGTTGDGEPSEELIGQTFTNSVGYKSTSVEVAYPEVSRAFVQYGLFAEGLFNRTDEVVATGDNGVELEIPELAPGTRYFYQVVAEDNDGNELLGEVQEINTLGYTVSATLTDAAGLPLPLTSVTLFSDPIQSQTDSNGVALFENVSPGEHTIDFNFEGEQISQPITVLDTITVDDGTPPEVQIYTVTASVAAATTAATEEGGSGLVAFIVVLVVLILIAVAVYFFIRRQQQPYASPTYTNTSNVITPGPNAAPPQDLNSVAGQYPAPGSVYDPNQPPR